MSNGRLFYSKIMHANLDEDVSTGPTSIIGLLTGQMVVELSGQISPATTAATISFSIGLICLVTGLLKLGWLLNFVSHPVLTGFITGAAIIILTGQVPALLGETGAPAAWIDQIPFILRNILKAKPLTVVIGFSGVALLLILQFIGQKWGKKSTVVWVICTSRNAIVLAIFTALSFGLNMNIPKKPLWTLTGTIPSGLQTPKFPSFEDVKLILPKSFPIFIAASLEHIAICTSFGRRNSYQVDNSQELTYLGVTNFINGIFGGMGVGGAISRSSVNSESGVKSPLGGVFTTGVVLAGIFALTGTLFWIPKASLAAVIIVAVVKIVPSYKEFTGFWRASFVDFVASLGTALITLFLSAELGIGFGVAVMVFYSLVRAVFARARVVKLQDLETRYHGSNGGGPLNLGVGTCVVSLDSGVFFLNATRIKSDILAAIRESFIIGDSTKERGWSDAKADQERPKGLIEIPYLRVLVVDFSRVDFVDASAMEMFHELKDEVRAGGQEVEIRFVGLNGAARKRFERVGWGFVGCWEVVGGNGLGDKVRTFEDLRDAIAEGSAQGRWPLGETDEAHLRRGDKGVNVHYVGF